MQTFRNAVDIGNRALDHCGATRIDTTVGFTEDSKNSDAVSSVYDKLRQAELRRNCWVFSTRRTALRPIDTNTMLLAPTLWSSTVTYYKGSLVTDETTAIWVSLAPDNLNNSPGNSPLWDVYFGPLTVGPWASDEEEGYFSGELVYVAPGDGTYKVFASLQNANTDNPVTATAWDATTIFFKDQIVTRSSVLYMSLIDLNQNQDPATAPALFNIATTYTTSDRVGASDGFIYTSVGAGNVGHNPVSDAGVHWTKGVLNPWTSVFVGGTGSDKWLLLTTALTQPQIVYPIGSGPSSQLQSRNVYRLPNAYLRKAPQDPKAGSSGFLGAPGAILYEDWDQEGDYIVSREDEVIVLRFVADITNVAEMDPMFCEGLAARIGMEICSAVTQSDSKKATIAGEYSRFMHEARLVNGIEAGSTESPEDEYITVRQ